uniref:Uncharacterized protein n=2 Tax=Ixodes scapularis TaxID=6945 RepID=A0A1S4KYC8_IXOSC
GPPAGKDAHTGAPLPAPACCGDGVCRGWSRSQAVSGPPAARPASPLRRARGEVRTSWRQVERRNARAATGGAPPRPCSSTRGP